MKNPLTIALTLTLLLLMPAIAFADDIAIENAWIRTMPAGAKIAAGYMDISNLGDTADTLISASAAGAASAKVHRMSIDDNGIMRMRPVPDGIEIAPGETANLAPGGLHLMIMGVAEPYSADAEIEVTLNFEKAGTMTTTFVVGPMASGGMAMPEHATND